MNRQETNKNMLLVNLDSEFSPQNLSVDLGEVAEASNRQCYLFLNILYINLFLALKRVQSKRVYVMYHCKSVW